MRLSNTQAKRDKAQADRWAMHEQWHPYFAWFAVDISPTDRRRWEWVERRIFWQRGNELWGGYFVTEYRPMPVMR